LYTGRAHTAAMVSKNFPGVPAEIITIISVEVSVLKSYVSISCTGAGFPPPPLLETFKKFPAMENSTEVFLADFPWAFIFAFSVLIVELISNMSVSEDETALTRGN
jgi:hypothetical protein